MCGIWAIFGIPNYPQYISHALKIASRGPDCFHMQTVPEFQNCCLAFHWLKVVDDLFGMQPMRFMKLPYFYMMFDGRIYNHKELGEKYKFDYTGNSDAEVILHLYNKFGIVKTAQLIDGVFAFCIIDTARKEMHLARDTFGVRPLFTLTAPETNQILAICSEIKGLAPVGESLKQDGLEIEIKYLLPGNFASYSLAVDGCNTLLKYESYTHVGKPPEFDLGLQPKAVDVMENIRDLLSEAVCKRLMGDRRVGCYLSGGLDSSLISALVTKFAKERGLMYPIQTFSIGMEGSPDIKAAREVAAHIGSEHQEVILTLEQGIEALRQTIYTTESYDPLLIQSAVFHYLLSKYISEKTDTVVLLSGEGADSLFQGFSYYHKAPSPEEADRESRRALGAMYTCGGMRADRCNSAHGLEHRAPFVDVQFMAYVLSLPAHTRQPKDGYEKWLLRASFDKTNLIPKNILWRSKLMFNEGASPSSLCESWFDILQKRLERQISDDAMAQAKVLYPFNTPKSKEALYYRQVFEELFPGCDQLIPSLWAPKW